MFVPQLVMAQPSLDADGYKELYLGLAIVAYFVVMFWYIRRKMERLHKPTGTHQGNA